MRRDVGGQHVHLAVISARRPQNVQAMQQHVGEQATWYVAEGDGAAYTRAGARHVAEAGALVSARNAALEDAVAQRLPCVQLSDDLQHLAVARRHHQKVVAEQATLDQVLAVLLGDLRSFDALLAGAAPHANPFYATPERPVTTTAFVVGDFSVIRPNPLRYDAAFPLSEDVDYALQHLVRYGRVARSNVVLARFAHRTNAGGVVSYRTPELERAMLAKLRAKWGDVVREHPRKPDFIQLHWPKPERTLA